MRQVHFVVGLLGAALTCGIVLARQDATTQESGSADKPAMRSAGRTPRLVQPWSKLTSLTEEQKGKIIALHAKANEEVNAIRDKEDADIMALLTDEQKTELQAMKEKARADGKARRAEKKTADDADKTPAGDAEKKKD